MVLMPAKEHAVGTNFLLTIETHQLNLPLMLLTKPLGDLELVHHHQIILKLHFGSILDPVKGAREELGKTSFVLAQTLTTDRVAA